MPKPSAFSANFRHFKPDGNVSKCRNFAENNPGTAPKARLAPNVNMVEAPADPRHNPGNRH